MSYRKIINLILCLTIALSLPIQTSAVDTVPPIPVSDSAVRDKEVGITVFGYTVPGITLDGILISGVIKPMISQIVNSTVNWINSGFEGNPAFVTNPKQYFTNIADGIAGDFIEGSDLGSLCSPFQTQIRLALQKSYTQPRQFQCTFTEAIGNLEDFYGDFNKGGWDAWFSMTQNSANNPYGSYLEAKIELDARIANAVNIKQDQLTQGRGFLSYEKCVGRTVTQEDIDDHDFRIVMGTLREENSAYAGKNVGDCLGEKQIVTPGSAIEGQLSNVLGTGVRQLELADEFDEIVGALIGQLLQKTVFSALGLLSSPNNVTGGRSGPAGSGTGSLPSQTPATPLTPVEVCTNSCAANYCPASTELDSPSCDQRAWNECVNQCIADSVPETPPQE